MMVLKQDITMDNEHGSLKHKTIIRLNVGGTVFQCFEDTLQTFPESLLARITREKDDYVTENGEYFFDRNPLIFEYILDACRKGVIHLPKDICGLTFKDELKFWELPSSHVAPCCWEALYNGDEDLMTMQKLMKNFRENTNVCLLLQEKINMKQKVWLFLDEPSSSKYAMIWGSFISILIVASTLIESLATQPNFMINYTGEERNVVTKMADIFHWDNTTLEAVLSRKTFPSLIMIDTAIHVVLTLEVIMSFSVCSQKKSYVTSITRCAVIIGYISFWVAFVMYNSFAMLNSIHEIRAYIILKYMSILKLGRLFYLTKRLPAFSIMELTFRSSRQELKILVFLLAILVSVFGFVMFVVEYFHNSRIDNIFSAMYWALITLTTVGYGDYAPVSVVGHLIAGLCAVCGVIVLALPIGIIASSFHTFYNYHNFANKHVRKYGKQLPTSGCFDEEHD